MLPPAARSQPEPSPGRGRWGRRSACAPAPLRPCASPEGRRRCSAGVPPAPRGLRCEGRLGPPTQPPLLNPVRGALITRDVALCNY